MDYLNMYLWQVIKRDIKELEKTVTLLILNGKIQNNIKFLNYIDIFNQIKYYKLLQSQKKLSKEILAISLINYYLNYYNITIHTKTRNYKFICKHYDNTIKNFIIECTGYDNKTDITSYSKFIKFDKMIDIISNI